MGKIKVGVLGATGMVGQKYISLLDRHPWFEVAYVAASPSSAGKPYEEAVANRWHMQKDIPNQIRGLRVEDANNIEAALNRCSFVFSALEMDKEKMRGLERDYAEVGFPVVSNTSAQRNREDVPILIPEINASHLEIIPIQQKNYGFKKGFIVTKPNCSIQSFMIPVHALMQGGIRVTGLDVVTQQAVSGAGYPGVASYDIGDNRIPFIQGEEEKTEKEPLKIWGYINKDLMKIVPVELPISAQCNRDGVIDGHTACVKVRCEDRPSLEEVISLWGNFRALPQERELPSAPNPVIIYRHENDRPQPRLDRDSGNGMAITVGRLRECSTGGIQFVGLSHNTVRGAAGGGILNAELLVSEGYIKQD